MEIPFNLDEDHLSKLTTNQYDHLLVLAAMFEGEFSIDWIVELTEIKVSQILSSFEKACRDGVLKKSGSGVFRFKNNKTKGKWQKQLEPGRKEALHHKIAGLLLRELPDDDSRAAAAAPHLLVGDNDVEKCRWIVRAGDLHLKKYQHKKAIECYQKVLKDLSSQRSEETDHVFIEAAIKYSKISTAEPDITLSIDILQEAMDKANQWNKQTSIAILKMHLAQKEWLHSRYHNALKFFQQGWSLAKKLGDPKLLRSAQTFGTFFLYWQGRFLEAVEGYENLVPDIEQYPRGKYPVLATALVGYCYGLVGQITQGLGMLDALRNYCLEKGDRFNAAWAGFNIGKIMLDIRRTPEAFQYIESAIEEARLTDNDFIVIHGKLFLAWAHFLNKNNKAAIACLHDFLKLRSKVEMIVQPYPYLMKLCYAMENGELPSVSGLSLDNEVRQMVKSENIFMKGVANRYKALQEKRDGQPAEKVIKTLNVSIRLLEKSGNQIQLARSQIELARQYLSMGKESKAKEIIHNAFKIMSVINPDLMPDDLGSFIDKNDPDQNLLEEILKLGQEVVAIRNPKDLVQHIISTVNRITGAERGAIFFLEENLNSPNFLLRASKNLTSTQIYHPGFASSMKLIEDVAASGKGRILEVSQPKEPDDPSDGVIRSRICVPMILRDKVVGVLYHDNRLFSSAFKESDLELLAYFAALAAFAMDNARAYKKVQRLTHKINEEKRYYQEQHLKSLNFEDIVGESKAIRDVLAQVKNVAPTETTVLILGETGVGKELVARAIHRHSLRHEKPIISVQCNALPESLIPSELFGHEKGAFTGATHQRIGRFELADGGTLFMDEIGDLPMDVQIRLLRVLQSKEFERIGGSRTLHSNFRLIAATNRNLEKGINAKRFRADLYYRLNVFPLYVPPLRNRKEDIPLLSYYFLRIFSSKMGKKIEGIPKDKMDQLMDYDWPGNVRELENVIERGTILSSGPQLRIPELGVRPQDQESEVNPTLEENERRHILWAVKRTGWKVRGPGGAAELLSIHPSTLSFKMKKLGIKRPEGIPKKRSLSLADQ